MSKYFLHFVISFFFINQLLVLSANNDTYINTKNIIYNEQTNIVELAENSKINVNDTNILVDRGIIDYNKDIIEVYGNFYLYQELNILSGKDLTGNTSLSHFTAKEVNYIYNNDLKIDSEEAKREDGIIHFYNNFLTPCDLEGFFNCPTWSLRIDKTKYEIDDDKFTHFDTFLQIADYKVFYLPYFSHYGSKAPRKKGFLTPTIEFSIGSDTSLITPYYLPVGDQTDVIFRPKITLDSSFNNTNNFSLNTTINHKNSGGNISLGILTKKLENNSNIYNTANLEAKQILDKKSILSYKAMITNSVSTTRSTNEEPITFEDIFIRLDRYNNFDDSDYLRTEISTVGAFDTTKTSLIPLAPSVKYSNQKLIENNFTLNNRFDLTTLKRDASNIDKPSDNSFLRVNNSLNFSNKLNNLLLFNNINFISSVGSYNFKHNSSLDDEIFRVNAVLSSDAFLNSYKNIKPRIKIVHGLNLVSDRIINEDSEAISFNYQNQFSDSRFYGDDLEDNTPRIIYGLENDINILNKNISININQSYDLNAKTNYTNAINQDGNFSDIALEASGNTKHINFKIDTRLDSKEYEKKEMNYSFTYPELLNLNLQYNETDKNAFRDLSSDTQSLKVGILKNINENINIGMNSNIDLKNNYSPYTQTIQLSLLDDCSRLDISYRDVRFNDNYNTKPNQTISIRYTMDYLGFFGYEQRSNLFFEEAGNLNYGL